MKLVGLVAVLSAGAAVALWLSTPAAVEAKQEPPFVLVESRSPGDSLWLEVRSAQPIFESDRPKLQFEVAGDLDTPVVLVLGGAFADANPACEGAFDVEPATLDSSDSLWTTLVSYARRRPGTGHLNGVEWRQLTGESEAEKWVGNQTVLVARGAELTGATDKIFVQSDTASGETFELATATLTCTFDRSALVDTFLYRERLRVPDVVVSQAQRTGDGMMRVAYQFDVKPQGAATMFRSTLGEATSHVDGDGLVVNTYEEDWWSRGGEGDGAILQTGGSVHIEPRDAAAWRNHSRLAAGVLATLAVAVASAGIASAVERAKWASK